MNEIQSVDPGDVPDALPIRVDWKAFAADVEAAAGEWRSVTCNTPHGARCAASRLRGRGPKPLAAPGVFDVRVKREVVFAMFAGEAAPEAEPESEPLSPPEEEEPEAPEPEEEVDETADDQEEGPVPVQPDEVYIDIDEDYFEEMQ